MVNIEQEIQNIFSSAPAEQDFVEDFRFKRAGFKCPRCSGSMFKGEHHGNKFLHCINCGEHIY